MNNKSSPSPHALSAPASGSYPDWILLDTLASGAKHRWRSLSSSAPASASSATTATASVKLENGAEAVVEISFRLFEPPDVSSFSVRCGGVRDDGTPYHACVVGAEGNVVLLYIILDRYEPGLFFVYTASHGSPSLDVLPRPSCSFNPTQSVGILPLAGGRGYLVAASACAQFLEGVFKCQLFLYSSETKAWSTKLAPVLGDRDTDWEAVRDHRTDKVIVVGGDSLGWVDLCRVF
nr:uncharacterized protein LOC127318692 [Lolium perenne]